MSTIHRDLTRSIVDVLQEVGAQERSLVELDAYAKKVLDLAGREVLNHLTHTLVAQDKLAEQSGDGQVLGFTEQQVAAISRAVADVLPPGLVRQ